MAVINRIAVILLQLLFSNIFGFTPAVAFDTDRNWELFIFVAGFTLGVWGMGALTERVARTYQPRRELIRLLSVLLLSILGALVILLTPPVGTYRIFYPLAGAFLGYYLPPLFLKFPVLDSNIEK